MYSDFSFIKKDSIFDKELISSLNARFDEIFNNNEYQTNINNVREINKNQIFNESNFDLILKIIQSKFEEIIDVRDLSFSKLWLVSSKSNDIDKTRLPYIPHIDYTRYLKAMVYLNDVNLQNGPIHLGKIKDSIDIEKKRKRLPSDYMIKNLNIIPEEHIKGKLIPMLGKAGDVIFFDTNTPHKAGIVKNEHFRKVLRFDFERPFFNTKTSLLQSFLKRLSNG